LTIEPATAAAPRGKHSSIDLDQVPCGPEAITITALYHRMKYLCEFMSEGCAAAAAVLWFVSASIRLKKPNRVRRGLESGLDDPKAVLIMVYRQSRWSAWAAIAAGMAAVFAIADGLLPGTQ
jgi:hypothetical protein